MVGKLTVLLFTSLALASAAFAERQPYERYETIVIRQMFGPLPPGFDPTKMASEVSKTDQKQLSQEQEKLKSSIHFSVINVTPDGSTAVGFTDKSDPKTPVHYYLKVGEERNGWKVKEADAAEATMTIAKGEIEVSLKIGGDSSKEAGATTRSVGAGSAARGASFASKGSDLISSGSLRAKRQLREQKKREEQTQAAEAAAQREAERQALAEAEKAQHEQERAEQRQEFQEKLQAIAEELKRVREAKVAEKKDEESTDSGTEQE